MGSDDKKKEKEKDEDRDDKKKEEEKDGDDKKKEEEKGEESASVSFSGDWKKKKHKKMKKDLLGIFAKAAGIDEKSATIKIDKDGDDMKIDFEAKGTKEELKDVSSMSKKFPDAVKKENKEIYDFLFGGSETTEEDEI